MIRIKRMLRVLIFVSLGCSALSCQDSITGPREVASVPGAVGHVSEGDTLPLIAVAPNTHLEISYLDNMGITKTEIFTGDTLTLYPVGLTVQYSLTLTSGTRGAVILNDSILPLQGSVTLQAGQILLAQSVPTPPWGADSALLVPAYQSFLANPTRAGLNYIREREDSIRSSQAGQAEKIITILRFIASPELLSDTLAKLDASLPNYPYLQSASSGNFKNLRSLSHPAQDGGGSMPGLTSPFLVGQNEVSFYYINGILTDPDTHEGIRKRLTDIAKDTLTGYFSDVSGVFNPTIGPFSANSSELCLLSVAAIGGCFGSPGGYDIR